MQAPPRQDSRHSSEEWFRTLAEVMPQIVCVLAVDGTPEYVNPSWTAFSGLDLARTARAGWMGVLHPDDCNAVIACRRRTLKTLAPQDLEVRYRAADGSFRWFLSRLAPVVEAGRVIRFVGTAMDIEDRKRAEEALRLGEEQLREANRQLREADRRKDEFLGMLSHELRNPLAPIHNSLFVLDRAGPGSHQARRALDILKRQALHLSRLVDDLLDVTRIARGKISLDRALLDLAALARRAAEDSRDLLADRGVELELDTPEAPVLVSADATRLAQVLGNLLHNAAKFTPRGGRVTVSVAADRGTAEVRVRDTGAGVEPSLLEAIFKPFTQGRQAARREGGLGLGLALVKGLVELHGGEVRALSEGPGRGTTLLVRLPLTAARAASPGTPPGAAAIPGAARRVLVVDDNRDAADSLAQLVRVLGHQAEVAYEAESALAKARAHPPDVILCDLGLPGMDGYAVAREVRRGGPAGVRLVAVTGYARPEDVERAAEAGFEWHVAKPPDAATIERALR